MREPGQHLLRGSRALDGCGLASYGRSMVTLTRVILLAAAITSVGCGHNGTLATRHGNDLILSKTGIPSFVGKANRCPGQNSEGKIQLSWDNGKKRIKGTCMGGVKVGTWKAYYENGALQWKASFEHGLIVGTFTSWYANDEKRARVGFRAGVPDGKFKAWHFSGEKRAVGKYVAGKKNGCWETWHENGQKASKGTYADDKKVLTWLYWTETGKRRKDKLGGRKAHGKCLLTL